jgi:hypothetical protein
MSSSAIQSRPKPPFPEQHRPRPGLESKLKPRYAGAAYRAAGKLLGKTALIGGKAVQG